MPVFRQDALTLHYLARGAGEPLVLIHGLGSSAADWGFQIPAFEPHFRVLAPDLPGCGHSPPPRGPYEIAELARVVWSLLDGLGLPAANVVGFSLGGAVALEMALQRPGAVPRLALINSLASYRIDHWRKWCEARIPAALVRLLGMRSLARIIAGRAFPLPWQEPMRQRVVDVVGAVPPATYLGMAAALERWCALDRLERLRSRTLLIAGELDYTPVTEKRLLASMLGASLVVVRESRHGTPFDAIGATNASLLAWLREQPLPERERWVRDDAVDGIAAQLAAGIAAEHAASVARSYAAGP